MSHKKYRQETDCLNCGADVNGKFCSECGQENLDVRGENFFHVAGHFLSDYFHYDSKFFKSLIPIFTKPGFLTRQYWDGKRTQYIHPLRLYFFIVIVAVLFTNFFYKHYERRVKVNGIEVNYTRDSVAQSLTEIDSGMLATRNQQALALKKAEEMDALKKAYAGMDHFMRDIKYIAFFLLPFFALVFKVLYIRRQSFFVDHLVYALHLQAFWLLSTSILLLIPLFYPPSFDTVNSISYLLIIVYTALSLRYLYKQSWWKTIAKSIIATFLIIIVAGMALGVYMAIAFLA